MQLTLHSQDKIILNSIPQIFNNNGSERIKLAQCSGEQDAGLQRCFRTDPFLRVGIREC